MIMRQKITFYQVNAFKRIYDASEEHWKRFPISHIVSLGDGRQILTNDAYNRNIARNYEKIRE